MSEEITLDQAISTLHELSNGPDKWLMGVAVIQLQGRLVTAEEMAELFEVPLIEARGMLYHLEQAKLIGERDAADAQQGQAD